MWTWALVLSCIIGKAMLEVQEWTDDEFVSKLEKHGSAFVKFFSPSCGHCRRLAPTWDVLGDKISSIVPVVKVDCTGSGKKLCSIYDVRGYPTLLLIQYKGKGTPKENKIESYNGARDLESLTSFVKIHMLPSVVKVEVSQVADFVKSENEFVFVAVVKSEDSRLLTSLKNVANEHKGFAKVGYVIRQGDEEVLTLPTSDVIGFYRPKLYVGREDLPLLTETNPENVNRFFIESLLGKVYLRKQIYDTIVDKPLLTVFIDEDINRDPSRFRMTRTALYDAAKEFDDVLISIGSSTNYQGILHEIGKTSFRKEYVVTYYEQEDKKYVLDKVVKFDELKSLSKYVVDFVKSVKAGNVPVFIKSEPIPTEDQSKKPVRKVVGKTFEAVVGDDSKDVLIAFVASWCGHCKQLEPIYDALGEKLKDQPNLVIARMDATENFIPKPYVVTGFPTIYFAPKGKKHSPVQYSGARTVDALVNWLKDRVTSPLKIDEDEL